MRIHNEAIVPAEIKSITVAGCARLFTYKCRSSIPERGCNTLQRTVLIAYLYRIAAMQLRGIGGGIRDTLVRQRQLHSSYDLDKRIFPDAIECVFDFRGVQF